MVSILGKQQYRQLREGRSEGWGVKGIMTSILGERQCRQLLEVRGVECTGNQRVKARYDVLCENVFHRRESVRTPVSCVQVRRDNHYTTDEPTVTADEIAQLILIVSLSE